MSERKIFLSALEIEDHAERQAHLQTECGGDLELLARVESLLTLNDSQSQFLETPVVQQMAGETEESSAPTILFQKGSTEDQELPKTEFMSDGAEIMAKNRDDDFDEIPLGYLQPSDKPGSLGRLAHYEVLQVLGRGAFGIVLKAMDEKLQRVVAIKVLAPEMAATSPARKRFLREARASAAIRHEHVVNIHAVDETPIPYLVMEYIPGQTLQQRLDDKGPLEILTVVQFGKQIAEGLAAAHEQDLIHRDIKPGNILLEEGIQERVKITDFGLARAADDASMTQSGLIAGTPMYMAPEQALGRKLDRRADLFSLGSVLYQMVSGRAPSALAVLKRVAEETPRSIREIIPETPQWLCDIIAKLHAKEPDQRYQTAKEVAEVLAHCEEQLKANARLQDFSKIPRMKPARGSGRWKWIAAAVLLLPVLGLATTEIAGVTHLLRKPQPIVAATGKVDPDVVSKANPAITADSDPDAEPKTPVTDPDRRAAEYVLSIGGMVRINGQVQDIKAVADLPAGAFTVSHLFTASNPNITDADLAVFKDCTDLNLEAVDIAYCKRVTNAGVAHLQGGTNLRYLNLALTQVTDAGLAGFRGCKALDFLVLDETQVTDAGLAVFKDCKRIAWLQLDNMPRVTDAGLAVFKDCKMMHRLRLSGTPFTDAGVAHLKDYQNLIELWLDGTPVTDAGLAHLTGLDKLIELRLAKTKVTAEGIAGLTKALPKCKITWDGGVIEPKVSFAP